VTTEVVRRCHALAALCLKAGHFDGTVTASDLQAGLGQTQNLTGLTVAVYDLGGMDFDSGTL